MRLGGHVARIEGRRCAYWILEGVLEGKRPPGRLQHRWENNIKVGLQEFGWGMNWIDLAQDTDTSQAVEIAVMNFLVP
jgi:hypothetical protein